MKKWEYRFDSFSPMNRDVAITRLDSAGSEGWELVTSFIDTHGEVGVIFKRELAGADTSVE